jgi:hypothetical protein
MLNWIKVRTRVHCVEHNLQKDSSQPAFGSQEIDVYSRVVCGMRPSSVDPKSATRRYQAKAAVNFQRKAAHTT